MMNRNELIYIPEPELSFGNNQKAADPRDGILLFGANEKFSGHAIKAGIIGPYELMEAYSKFVKRLQSPIISQKKIYGHEVDIESQRPSFPGFEAAFEIEWPDNPEYSIGLDTEVISGILNERFKKKRTKALVELYSSAILKARKDEDVRLDIWFILVSRDTYLRCRFGSKGRDITTAIEKKIEALNQGQAGLFPDYDEELRELEALKSDSSDFHNLLKATLLQERVETPVQVIVDSTLDFRDKLLNRKYTDDMKAHLAWTQSVGLYYKLGKLPWVLGSVRANVCYLGLVFKKVKDNVQKSSICSAAQMFLKDGDGTIFRGNIGLFKSENSPEYHLDKTNAEYLLGMALDDFHEKHGTYPIELFIHGRVRFNDTEWEGFENAVNSRQASTILSGIVIKDTREDYRKRLKLFKDSSDIECNYGIMRGLAWIVDGKTAYLYTRGFIPKTGSTNHSEIANPLYIEVHKGDAKIEIVLNDILALTKLNYNACIYGDGLPVTLRFSDLIGNILTATAEWQTQMRQFRYYI